MRESSVSELKEQIKEMLQDTKVFHQKKGSYFEAVQNRNE